MADERTAEVLAPGITLIRGLIHECCMWVIEGEKSAALIDTGIGYGGIKAMVEEITLLPYCVINTHGHGDHSGGNYEFDTANMHADAVAWARDSFRMTRSVTDKTKAAAIRRNIDSSKTNVNLIREGDIFDLGGRTLTVYETPGHTAGDIVLHDSLTGLMFCGDFILHKAGPLLTEPNKVSVKMFRDSLKKLTGITGITGFLSGHDRHIIPAEFLYDCLNCADGLLDGSVIPQRVDAGLPRGELMCLKGILGNCSIRYFDSLPEMPKEE